MSDAPPRLSYPLTPAQKFFEASLWGEDHGLNIEQVVCASTESLDFPGFRQAWQTIIDRHPALRTGFKRTDRLVSYQEIQSPVELPIFVEDRQQLKTSDRDTFLEEWLERDRCANFDLSTAPLMRVAVIRYAENVVTWVWTFHHILMDGRSFLLVLEDLFACYEAICARHTVVLAERKPFSEFVSWHESWLATHQKAAESYWRKLFANDETDSVLSIGRKSLRTDLRQEKIELKLEAATMERMLDLAKDFGLTANTIIQGAWGLLLSRYYRSNCATFATVRSGRRGSIEGTDGMIGMLMNILPVHVRIYDDVPVIEFLKGIREQQVAVRSHEWTPWNILRDSIPHAAAKQFFDSYVLYERYDAAQEMNDRHGKKGLRTFSLRERSNVPLILLVRERPQLRFDLVYQATLFEAEDVAQLGRSFMALLRHIVEDPKAPVGTMKLLDPADQASVIKRLSGPELAVSEDKGLHQWFEDQARKTPHNLALVGEITLTYEQLDRQSSALARRLVTMGVTADQLVLIFLPRSALTIVAILGVLKSGAAYFPIDVTIPKTRLNGLFEDARPVAIITDEAHVRKLPTAPIPVALLDDKMGNETSPTGPELPRVRGSQLAYVIPTSGTTGRPKLIGVEHRQTAHLLAYATQCLLQPADVRCVPFIDSPSADSSVSQIFTTLALGGTLVLVPEILEISGSPYYEKFTCVGTVHSLLTVILNGTGLPPSVRFIGLGAETIPAELLERLDGIPQVKKVINYYGPTEATVYCTAAILLDRAHPQNKIDLHNRGWVIGRPIANTRIYLVDDSGQLVPPGAVGEIYIAGGLIARGYLNFTGKETANFLPDHFAPASGERMYRTGDLARLRTDGQLEFHGRKDHQLKFNGVRIEAAEIENALLSCPGISRALVDLRSDESGKKRLVAYLVAEGGNVTRQKLKKILRLLLPGAMIPQHFLAMENFPLTPNGKVDREALARLALDLEPSRQPSLSTTPTENRMKEILEGNLSRTNIGLEQDYFELGGDSLSSLGLLMAIEKQFGVRLKPPVLLESSTIIDLAREVDNVAKNVKASPSAETSLFLPLQELGNKTPLILIPGGSGERFLAYKNFAHGFLPDHPVHVLQSPYAQMNEKSDKSVAQLSIYFARQILSLVKGRPFVLFGHCVGGLLAWHIACALQKEKVPPFKLAIYDSPVPQKGINSRSRSPAAAPKTRFQRMASAYQLAWGDWSIRHDDTWSNKARFFLWAINNVVMRNGLDRSETGKDNFAKLTYLRALQSCPLSHHSGEALLLYHHLQEEFVSQSLWNSHSSGAIRFGFISGDHNEWESAIFNAIPLVRDQLESLDVLSH